MTDVRTFRAATMQEALDLVREELGGDAVILHTRQVERKRLLPWRTPMAEIEITASLTLGAPAARRAARTKRTPEAPSSGSHPKPAPSAAGRTPGARLDVASEPSNSIAELLNRAPSEPADRPAPTAQGRLTQVRVPRDVKRSASETRAPDIRTNRFTGRPIGSRSPAIEGSDPTAALARRLDAIQQTLQNLEQANLDVRRGDVPNELFQLYTELIDAEVTEDVAHELIAKLKRSALPRQLSDRAAARAVLTAMVESEIRCCEPITAGAGRRKVVALVGATGVGKTTTIAKLAANFRLRSGIKMGLVTVDTYRVAAVEQLRTYAEIIDLPMKVVTNPVEMRRALDELAGLDLVLIDTAGRSPKDDLQIQDLKLLLSEARVDEVHLVLSMTTSLRSLESSAETFAAAGTTALILTKLDEASGMGALLSVARAVALPFSYLTTGQDVPDDIEPAHPTRIARLILGQERVGK